VRIGRGPIAGRPALAASAQLDRHGGGCSFISSSSPSASSISSHRIIACFENRAGALDLDDDGPVARHQLHRHFVAGWLGSFWSSMDKISFFIMIAAIAASAGEVIWSFNRPLKGILQG
jgi:hypothetical protein